MEFDYTCQPGLKDWALDYVKTGKLTFSFSSPIWSWAAQINSIWISLQYRLTEDYSRVMKLLLEGVKLDFSTGGRFLSSGRH